MKMCLDYLNDFQTEYSQVYVKHQIVRRTLRKPKDSFRLSYDTRWLKNDLTTIGQTTINETTYVPFVKVENLRRRYNLKLEEGVMMERKTETQEKYCKFDRQERPPLCKKNTNLHLEGDLDITNIYVENYPKYEPQKRPTLTKHDTNLKITGDLTMNPEYREVFIEYKHEKQKPTIPKNNLITDGFFRTSSDESKTILHDSHHQIPFLRENKDYVRNKRIKQRINLQLDGKIDFNPEYKNAYIDFYKDDDGRKLPNTTRPRLISHPPNLKTEGHLDLYPEYKSAYINFPRERPTIRRPDCHIINDGDCSNYQSEKSEKFVQHTNVRKASPLKREPELKLEGTLECQPEYRRAYINYIKRERMDRKARPIDNLSTTIQHGRVFDSDENRQIDKDKETLKNVKVPNKESSKSADEVRKQGPTKASNIPILIKKPSTIESSDVESNYTKRSTSSSSAQQREIQLISKVKEKRDTKTFDDRIQQQSQTNKRSKTCAKNKNPIATPARQRRLRFGQSRSSSRISTPSDDVDNIIKHVSREGKRYRAHVSVEDLAHTNQTLNPISDIVNNLKLIKGNRKDAGNVSSRPNSRAFLVLTSDDVSDRVSTNLYKEEKWMPSWY